MLELVLLKLLILKNVCGYFIYKYVCIPHVCSAHGGTGVTEGVEATTWELGIKLGSLGRMVGVSEPPFQPLEIHSYSRVHQTI